MGAPKELEWYMAFGLTVTLVVALHLDPQAAGPIPRSVTDADGRACTLTRGRNVGSPGPSAGGHGPGSRTVVPRPAAQPVRARGRLPGGLVVGVVDVVVVVSGTRSASRCARAERGHEGTVPFDSEHPVADAHRAVDPAGRSAPRRPHDLLRRRVAFDPTVHVEGPVDRVSGRDWSGGVRILARDGDAFEHQVGAGQLLRFPRLRDGAGRRGGWDPTARPPPPRCPPGLSVVASRLAPSAEDHQR